MYNLSSIPEFNDLLKSDCVSNSNILKLNKIKCITNFFSTYRVIKYDKSLYNIDYYIYFDL